MIKPFVWRATSEKSVKCNKKTKKTTLKRYSLYLTTCVLKHFQPKKRRNTQQEAQFQLEWNLFVFFGNISFWKCMDHHNWKRKIDKGKFIFFFTAVEFQTDHFELFKLWKKNSCCLFFWSSISFWFPLEEFIFTNVSASCSAFLRFCLVLNVCTGKMNAIWTISVCWALEASVLFFVYACIFLLVFFSAKTIGVLCNFNCRWCVWGQCLVVFLLLFLLGVTTTEFINKHNVSPFHGFPYSVLGVCDRICITLRGFRPQLFRKPPL